MAGSTDWAKLLEDLRQEHGISQRALCEGANIWRGTYRRFRRGSARLTIAQLERLLGVLGYELDAMMIVGRDKGA
ncbi:helix-turn-helix transcriptional regulator [Nitratireductor sp. StC3]|uniref:helix-turn-helix domain-containing protein n=1 Tax=Nitratireductor sp. StC3 TaxID=2126741 RepID=UPI000D0CD9A7|nr:helix-turn-helix transcriptional regulator [Nitratireductor sp. StC3]PSM16121.1 hypothetical protein C7T96_21590 [Nitratireductor sp. StC3]